MADKHSAYAELVAKRKNFTFADAELTNPSATPFDVTGIEPWSHWQGNVDASIVVVGQEFCDVDTYTRVKGTVEQKPGVYEYPANRNLAELFQLLGYELGHPLNPNRSNPIFFTNAVMGLKSGSMSSNFKDRWMEESRREFLGPLLSIIQPKVIITIGTKATLSLGKLYGFPVRSHAEMVSKSPIRIDSGPIVFPVYHTGGLGLTHRSKSQQVEDWKRIAQHL